MKGIGKSLFEALCFVLILPVLMGYWCGALLLGGERVFPGCIQMLALLPGVSGAACRRVFLRWTLANCGEGVFVSFGTIVSSAGLKLGNNVYIGAYCCLGAITIEDDVLIATRVSVMNGGRQHGIDRLDVPVREQPGDYLPVRIGRDTWIGEGAIVMADVGAHCVIGAGAVVTKSIPDYSIAMGVPARVVGTRRLLARAEGNDVKSV